jgi:hypothetical protein
MTRYRLAGIPVSFSTDNDVLIEDEHGRLYFLGRNMALPAPVPSEELPIVSTFYDPVLQTRWVDLDELSLKCFSFLPSRPAWNDMTGAA